MNLDVDRISSPRRPNLLAKYLLINGRLHVLIVAVVGMWIFRQEAKYIDGLLLSASGTGTVDASHHAFVHRTMMSRLSATFGASMYNDMIGTLTDGLQTVRNIDRKAVDSIDLLDVALPNARNNGPGSDKEVGVSGSLPPSYKTRCETAGRLTSIKEAGGNFMYEKAVSTAFGYFKSKQNSDGSWGTSNKGAMTGLVLLCYLGRCETPDSPIYSDNMMKGLLYLLELSKKNPEGIMSQEMRGYGTPYEHAIATCALGEMYLLGRLGGKALPGMREAYEQALKTIVKYQHSDGSWTYDGAAGTYAPAGRDDLSVTGWQCQALKTAELSNFKVDGLDYTMEKVVQYLEKKQTKDGGFGSRNREGLYNQWDLTGAGLLGLQTLGRGKWVAINREIAINRGIKFAYDYFQKEPPSWKTAKLYDWFYYTQAFFQKGGPEWKMWNDTALPLVLAHQNPDGSWNSNGQGMGAGAGGDNIYPTAQCTLMLEVYYR